MHAVFFMNVQAAEHNCDRSRATAAYSVPTGRCPARQFRHSMSAAGEVCCRGTPIRLHVEPRVQRCCWRRLQPSRGVFARNLATRFPTVGHAQRRGLVMSVSEVAATPRSQYVDFWNTVLVPKFVRWKHILVDGLTLHSAKVFPSLPVKSGDKAVDAGCGFGDTAMQLAGLVGPFGSILAVDCCDGFLEYGRKDEGGWHHQHQISGGRCADLSIRAGARFLLLALRNAVL